MIVVLDPATGRLKKRPSPDGTGLSGMARSSSLASMQQASDLRSVTDPALPRAVSSGTVGDGDNIVMKTSAGHNLIHGFLGEVC